MRILSLAVVAAFAAALQPTPATRSPSFSRSRRTWRPPPSGDRAFVDALLTDDWTSTDYRGHLDQGERPDDVRRPAAADDEGGIDVDRVPSLATSPSSPAAACQLERWTAGRSTSPALHRHLRPPRRPLARGRLAWHAGAIESDGASSSNSRIDRSPDRCSSGAISASGSSTNRRSRKRGCGTTRPGSSITTIAVQHQVQIERARRVRIGPLPSACGFDRQQRLRADRAREARSAPTAAAFRKSGCGPEQSDRHGVVDSGMTAMSASRSSEPGDGEVEVRPPVAEVRAEARSRDDTRSTASAALADATGRRRRRRAAEQIGPAGERLFEEALLLERLRRG